MGLTYPNLGHGGHEVATGGLELVDDGVGRQGPHAGDALHVLVGEVGLALLFALGQGHIEGLGAHDAAVHLGHGLGGLLRGGEADEAEPLGAALLQHDLKHQDASHLRPASNRMLHVKSVLLNTVAGQCWGLP